jgi:hypothetical protein
VHNFGRTDEVDRDGLRRLINSINRVLDAGDALGFRRGRLTDGSAALPEIEIERVFELGVVLVARQLGADLGIWCRYPALCPGRRAERTHKTALFAMAAQRLETPGALVKLAKSAARAYPNRVCRIRLDHMVSSEPGREGGGHV